MNIEKSLRAFIADESLPEIYYQSAMQWFIPLSTRITEKVQLHHKRASAPFILGINGAQGSGKSTLSALLVRLFQDTFKLRSISMSLDDFYLVKSERLALGESIHPLLATRGVPGTHDLSLLNRTLHSLLHGHNCAIPWFDKAVDDRAKPQHWLTVNGAIDVVVLEGWCVGAPAQDSEQLKVAVNQLERDNDPEGIWRNYVNQKLADEYQQVFSRLDYLLMLKAPSFAQIYTWRCEQEHKMQQRNLAKGLAKGGMSDQQIANFVQHYQRITEHSLEYLPELCDEVFDLNPQRSIEACQTR